MICHYCNDELDPTDHNRCEACDFQDAFLVKIEVLQEERNLYWDALNEIHEEVHMTADEIRSHVAHYIHQDIR